MRRKKGLVMQDEQLVGSVPISTHEELRVTMHVYRGRPMVNIRRWRLLKSGWAHCPSGVIVGDVTFLELLPCLQEAARRIQGL